MKAKLAALHKEFIAQADYYRRISEVASNAGAEDDKIEWRGKSDACLDCARRLWEEFADELV